MLPDDDEKHHININTIIANYGYDIARYGVAWRDNVICHIYMHAPGTWHLAPGMRNIHQLQLQHMHA